MNITKGENMSSNKRYIIGLMLVLALVFGAMGIAGCSSSDDDSADAEETTEMTDEEKLVGTWEMTEEESTWEFNDDGTGSYTEGDETTELDWTLDGSVFEISFSFENDYVETDTAELTWISDTEIELGIEDGTLCISGERKSESEEKDEKRKFHRIERSYGSYQRSFRLPENIDKGHVEAEFTDGVLRVHLPKRETTPQKVIPVK